MSLDEYAAKRRFEKTPEPPPSGEEEQAGGQTVFLCATARCHAAALRLSPGDRRRFEILGRAQGAVARPGGEASSRRTWKITPWSTATSKATFRRAITAAGSVMLWDRGTFDLLGDVAAEAQLARGDLKFRLHGEKLKGDFAIVHMKGRGKGNEWLLIKKRDEFAVAGLGRGGAGVQRAFRPHAGRDRAQPAGAQDQARDGGRGRSRMGDAVRRPNAHAAKISRLPTYQATAP